jgi:hypothetical protein
MLFSGERVKPYLILNPGCFPRISRMDAPKENNENKPNISKVIR